MTAHPRSVYIVVLRPDPRVDGIRALRGADHFVTTDTHLIAAYVQAVVYVQKLAKEIKTDPHAVPLWATVTKV